MEECMTRFILIGAAAAMLTGAPAFADNATPGGTMSGGAMMAADTKNCTKPTAMTGHAMTGNAMTGNSMSGAAMTGGSSSGGSNNMMMAAKPKPCPKPATNTMMAPGH
jgi:hypothetical protein